MIVTALHCEPWDPVAEAVTNVYLATADLRTRPGDALASTLFQGVIAGWRFERDAWAPGRIGGATLPGRGTFLVDIPEIWVREGRLADLLSYGWDGRRFRLYRVDTVTGWAGRVLAASGTFAGPPEQTARTQLTLRAHDRAEDLRRPVQANTYGGTGGTDGTVELTGRPKPLVFGRVPNAPAIVVDPTGSGPTCDVHDGRIQEIEAARDNGIDLPVDASNPPPSGDHYPDTTNGRVILGGNPAGRVTVDVKGAAPGGVWADDLAAVVRLIVTAYGGLADPAELATASFTQLATDRPGEVGIATGDTPVDIAELLDRLMGGAGGWWYFDRSDLFTVGVYRAPTATAPTDAVIKAVIDPYRVDLNSMIRTVPGIPPCRVDAQYFILGAVQREDELAGAVTAADRKKWSTPFLVAPTENAAVVAKHLRAVPLAIATYAYGATLAGLIGSDLSDLLASVTLLRFRTDLAFGTVEIGDEVWITHADYAVPSPGKPARVLGFVEDQTGLCEMEVAVHG